MPPMQWQSNYGEYIDQYREGITRATAEGLIRWGNPLPDDYSHFPNIDGTNTRALHPCVQKIAALLHGQRSAATHVLELGHGVGRAAGDVREMLPESIIHTIGLTPFNPYLHFKKGPSEIVDAISHQLKHIPSALPPRLITDFESLRRKVQMDIGFVLAAQQYCPALEIHKKSERPIADLQQIDTFPFPLQAETYDLIFEYHGALLKTFTPENTAIVRNALRENGAMVLVPLFQWMPGNASPERIEIIRRGLRKTDCVMRCLATGAEDALIVAPDESPVATLAQTEGSFDRKTRIWSVELGA